MQIKEKLKLFDLRLEKYKWLLLLLLCALILRIPSFFEPYWYGDEAIYLSIGNALNQGKVLYRDIVDHKTPIIYYLARVGSQLNFRLLLTGSMLISYSLFYFIVLKISKNHRLAWIISGIFILLTSLPLLEGLIPNGELFVMGFVLASIFVLSKNQLWQAYFQQKNQTHSQSRILLSLSGALMGLAILTKVPAAFDAAGVLLIGWFSWIDQLQLSLPSTRKNIRHSLNQLILTFRPFSWWLLGLTITIAASIIYFFIKGAGPEYLRYGILYNFHYVSTWKPTTASWFDSLWLSLSGKLAIASLIIIWLSLTRKHTSSLFKWSAGWSVLALVATTLSNRPYPHYLLQLTLPTCLLIASLGASLITKRHRVVTLLTTSSLILLFFAVNSVINFGTYSSLKYYQNFSKLLTGQITYKVYSHNFDAIIEDNAKAAQIINNLNIKEMYIWGTNPAIYAQTLTSPPDPFLVLFHIQDLGLVDVAVKNVIKASPPIIVVMKTATAPPQIFSNFLHNAYIPITGFDHFTLWRIRQ